MAIVTPPKPTNDLMTETPKAVPRVNAATSAEPQGAPPWPPEMPLPRQRTPVPKPGTRPQPASGLGFI